MARDTTSSSIVEVLGRPMRLATLALPHPTCGWGRLGLLLRLLLLLLRVVVVPLVLRLRLLLWHKGACR